VTESAERIGVPWFSKVLLRRGESSRPPKYAPPHHRSPPLPVSAPEADASADAHGERTLGGTLSTALTLGLQRTDGSSWAPPPYLTCEENWPHLLREWRRLPPNQTLIASPEGRKTPLEGARRALRCGKASQTSRTASAGLCEIDPFDPTRSASAHRARRIKNDGRGICSVGRRPAAASNGQTTPRKARVNYNFVTARPLHTAEPQGQRDCSTTKLYAARFNRNGQSATGSSVRPRSGCGARAPRQGRTRRSDRLNRAEWVVRIR